MARGPLLLAIALLGGSSHPQAEPARKAASAPFGDVVYRCPGPPVVYTDAITAEVAAERGCRAIEPDSAASQPAAPKRAAAKPPKPVMVWPLVPTPEPPPPKVKRELGTIDRWRYETCMENANKAPTVVGVRSGQDLCNDKFGQ